MKRLLYISLLFASCSILEARSTEDFPHPRIGVQDSYVYIYTRDHSRRLVLQREKAYYLIIEATQSGRDSLEVEGLLDGMLSFKLYSGASWWDDMQGL